MSSIAKSRVRSRVVSSQDEEEEQVSRLPPREDDGSEFGGIALNSAPPVRSSTTPESKRKRGINISPFLDEILDHPLLGISKAHGILSQYVTCEDPTIFIPASSLHSAMSLGSGGTGVTLCVTVPQELGEDKVNSGDVFIVVVSVCTPTYTAFTNNAVPALCTRTPMLEKRQTCRASKHINFQEKLMDTSFSAIMSLCKKYVKDDSAVVAITIREDVINANVIKASSRGKMVVRVPRSSESGDFETEEDEEADSKKLSPFEQSFILTSQFFSQGEGADDGDDSPLGMVGKQFVPFPKANIWIGEDAIQSILDTIEIVKSDALSISAYKVDDRGLGVLRVLCQSKESGMSSISVPYKLMDTEGTFYADMDDDRIEEMCAVPEGSGRPIASIGVDKTKFHDVLKGMKATRGVSKVALRFSAMKKGGKSEVTQLFLMTSVASRKSECEFYPLKSIAEFIAKNVEDDESNREE